MGGIVGGVSNAKQQKAVGSLQFQTSQHGGVIPLVYGTTRVSPNLIAYDDFQATPSSRQGGAGKGGGGGKGGGRQYKYSASVIMGVCQGPIAGIDDGDRKISARQGAGDSQRVQDGRRSERAKYPQVVGPGVELPTGDVIEGGLIALDLAQNHAKRKLNDMGAIGWPEESLSGVVLLAVHKEQRTRLRQPHSDAGGGLGKCSA